MDPTRNTLTVAVVAATIVGALFLMTADAEAAPLPDRAPKAPKCVGTAPEGARCVDLGPWSSVTRCESGDRTRDAAGRIVIRALDAQAIGAHTDRGVWQFIPTSWDYAADIQGRAKLKGRDPRRTSVATQLHQAEALASSPGRHNHWTCHRIGYRYGVDRGPVWIYGEAVMPKYPKRCTRRIVNRVDGFTVKAAASVCGWTRSPVRIEKLGVEPL